MTLGRHVLGWFVLVLVGGGPAFVAVELRRRLLPRVPADVARLTSVLVALATVVVLTEVLGVIGWFGRSGLAVGGAALWLAGGVLRLRRASGSRPEQIEPGRVEPERLTIRQLLAGAGLAAGVAGAWLAQAGGALRNGVVDFDSLDYHLPLALAWYQSGRIGPLHLSTPESPVATYPANAELLHAIGMAAFDRDVLTPVLNLGWLAIALGAVWIAGQARGRRVAALAALVPLLVLPVVVQSQPGSALTDIASLAALLGAVALLLRDDRDRMLLAVAGLAAGLAIGTKLTVSVAVLALTAVLAIRLRRGVLPWLAGLLPTASFWFVRNIVVLGSPLPAVALPGLPAQDLALVRDRGQSVLSYADDPSAWTKLLVPQLRDAYGPVWYVIVLLALAGAVLALLRGTRHYRQAKADAGFPVSALGGVGLLAFLGYLATPSTAGGADAALFATDTRYAIPALTLCLLAGVLALPENPRLLAGVSALLVVVAAVGYLVPWRREWFQPGEPRPLTVLVAAGLGVGVAAGLRARRAGGAWWSAPLRSSPVSGWAAAALLVVAVPALALPVERRYLVGRYAGSGTFEGLPREVFGAFRDISSSRVAVGGLTQTYPYAGTDLSNHVAYAGTVGRRRELREATSCRQWREVLRGLRADYVVVAANVFQGTAPAPAAWTRTDPNAQVLLDRGRAIVLRLTGPPDPTACPPSPPAA